MNDNPTKWPNTFKQFVGKLPTNFLSVFGHFVNLALKGLKLEWQYLNPQRLLISYWLRLGSMSLKLFFLYPFYLEILYWRIIKFENKIFFFFFVCVKRITLCNCLCSSPSFPRSSALSGISRNSEQKTILQTTKQLIQFIVLEIQFRSLKYMTVIRICKNLSNIPFLSKR